MYIGAPVDAGTACLTGGVRVAPFARDCRPARGALAPGSPSTTGPQRCGNHGGRVVWGHAPGEPQAWAGPRACGGAALNIQPLVLVADDEPRITKLVSIALSEEGFRVVAATGGEEALQRAEEVRPDIVLLDIVMPDLDGIEVMRRLRERRPVPVILLTAKGSTGDKAKGLDLGADDYVAKPFHPDELAARVRAVIRRSSGTQPGAGVLRFDDVEIDLERRMVTRSGELVQLSRTEWLLLQHLATNAGKVVLHTELLTKVWGPEYRDDLQYLRVWISRVRRKLGARPGEPGRIRTFQGIGYLLDVDGDVQAGAPAASPVSGGGGGGSR
jgi:two-component system KDP operon response regulator KdpE